MAPVTSGQRSERGFLPISRPQKLKSCTSKLSREEAYTGLSLKFTQQGPDCSIKTAFRTTKGEGVGSPQDRTGTFI